MHILSPTLYRLRPSEIFGFQVGLDMYEDSPTERIITQRITSERITSELINTERITS